MRGGVKNEAETREGKVATMRRMRSTHEPFLSGR